MPALTSSTIKKIFLLALFYVLFCATALFFFRPANGRQTVQDPPEGYTLNKNLTTILIMGVDKEDGLRMKRGISGANGQADMLLLVVIDKETHSIKAIPIRRETMMSVDVYAPDGTYEKSVEEQLCLQYAYGRETGEGSRFMCEHVESLFLGQIPIDYYVTVAISSADEFISIIEPLDVTMSQDYATVLYYDTPQLMTYLAGQTYSLSGYEAYCFIRYRDINHLETNPDRIARGKDFIRAYVKKAKEKAASNPLFIAKALRLSFKDFDTNMSLYQMLRVALSLKGADFQSIDFAEINGVETHGAKYDEFYPDQDALQELILETWYTEE